MSGKNVTPRIVSYKGGDIVLCAEENVVLSPVMFPELNDYKGQDIIVTNGKTLLGADDKAGVAAIISAVQYLKDHPEIEHGKIRIGFTPDEEIGQATCSRRHCVWYWEAMWNRLVRLYRQTVCVLTLRISPP